MGRSSLHAFSGQGRSAIVTTELFNQVASILDTVLDVASLPAPATSRQTRSAGSDDLAYLVHTSGSTGKRKFVEVQHRSLVNALEQLVGLYAIHPGDRRLAQASPGADFYISETLVTLAAGATLVFPPATRSAYYFRFFERDRWISNHRSRSRRFLLAAMGAYLKRYDRVSTKLKACYYRDGKNQSD